MRKHMKMRWETFRYGPYGSGTWKRYVPGAGLWLVCPSCDETLREQDLQEVEADRREVRSHIVGGIIAAIIVMSCIVADFIAETLAGH